MRPINSQMDRAQWSSSIILSTSTVRNTNCERSIDARRGGDDVFTLAVYPRSRQRNSSSVDAKANFFTASRRTTAVIHDGVVLVQAGKGKTNLLASAQAFEFGRAEVPALQPL